MCDRLSELRKATSHYAAGLDPDRLSCSDAARIISQASAMEASLQTIKALAAIRAAESGTWKETGHRSAAEALAAETSSTVGAARELIDTGRRLRGQPEVSRAARRGDLSFAQVALIANATEADPDSQGKLLEKAKDSSLTELKNECAVTKANAHPDPERRRAEIRSRRYARSWTDVEGMWHLAAAGNPEDGAQIMAALNPITDQIFQAARKEGRREPADAYAFDALVQLAKRSSSSARSPASSSSSPSSRSPSTSPSAKPDRSDDSTSRRFRDGAPVKILVRIDYDAFLRGVPTKGETCEIVGFGPVSVSAVKELIETGDPFVVAILTRAKRVVGVAHPGRKPTAHQESALQWLYPSCAVQGCSAQARLERDHTLDWSKTHFTAFDHLDLLCSHHHDLKTRQNWALTEGRGKRAFVPPEDPRHPRQKHKRSSAPSTGPPIAVA
ncbi:MAG: DUF222 domain-containing protein [Acidimicrobiales bacterium]